MFQAETRAHAFNVTLTSVAEMVPTMFDVCTAQMMQILHLNPCTVLAPELSS